MMTEAKILMQTHQEAMRFAQQAGLSKDKGKLIEANGLFQQAFDLEKTVVAAYLDRKDAEPTRSVLLRSAAVLASELKLYREAEKFIAHALAGNPPENIANELRKLYEDIQDQWHPKVKKIKIPNGSAQNQEIEGVLSMVDFAKNKIRVDADSGRYKFELPNGMSDIVKTYVDNNVRVTYATEGKKHWLKNIQKAG
jgi:tetratricopeptide (TPR) repeat protein